VMKASARVQAKRLPPRTPKYEEMGGNTHGERQVCCPAR